MPDTKKSPERGFNVLHRSSIIICDDGVSGEDGGGGDEPCAEALNSCLL